MSQTHTLAAGPAALVTLDDSAIDWAEIGQATYLLHQHFSYDYDSPAANLTQRLVVVPPANHGTQRRLQWAVSSSDGVVDVSVDRYGNLVATATADCVTGRIEFDAWAVVTRGFGTAKRAPRRSKRLALKVAAGLTAADDTIIAVAASLAAEHDSDRDLTDAICRWTNAALVFTTGVTGTRTTAVEALTQGKGVCQDYSHLMLAVCRTAGLTARYVSGHCLGEADVSHAWVEVLVHDDNSDPSWVAYDPTGGVLAGPGHLTVAVGADYSDVAPLSGWCVTRSPGRLTVTKRAGVIAVSRRTPVAA